MNIYRKNYRQWSTRLGLLLVLSWLAILLVACGGTTAPNRASEGAPTGTTVTPAVSAVTVLNQVTAPPPLVAATSTPFAVPTSNRATEGAPTTQSAPTATKATATILATTVPTRGAEATPTVAPVVTIVPTVASQPTTFSGTIAHDHLKVLVDQIGIRAAGTPGHEKAADYIESYFKSLGLKTERPTVSFKNFVDKGSWVRYSQNQPIEIKGVVFRQSANGEVSAPLVNAGKALNGQLAKGSLQGAIALIERGDLTFHDKVKNAKDAGALGVIIYNNLAGDLTSGVIGEEFGLPVLGISQEKGRELLLLAQSGATVQISVQFSLESRDFTNVVGVRPALDTTGASTAPILIIGGHFDSVPAGPGANDNASGTVITLELARVLQNRYPGYELRFIAFGGEEIGLLGSDDYASKMSQAERKRVIAMINIDMVTVGTTLEFGGTPKLVQLAFAAANELGAGDVQAMPSGIQGSSDHASFMRAGMPAIFFYRDGDQNYHLPSDTSEKVTPPRLEILGNIVIKVIDKISYS